MNYFREYGFIDNTYIPIMKILHFCIEIQTYLMKEFSLAPDNALQCLLLLQKDHSGVEWIRIEDDGKIFYVHDDSSI